jgi:predicted transposase YdaD
MKRATTIRRGSDAAAGGACRLSCRGQAGFPGKLLYERNWDKQRIIDLFGVIDWLMQLPTDLEQRLLHEVYTLERNVSMPYVTSAERFGIEKGQEGQEGRQEGRQEGEAALLKRLLARRFGALPDAVQVRLTTADVDQLEEWAIKVLDAESLDEVFDQRPQ